jgi:putative hydrolase of the HAD superfamily
MSNKMDQRMATHPNPGSKVRSECKQNKAGKLRPKPYLLFDAGGTLVFPDQSFLIEQARARGIELTETQLFEGYYQLIHTLDCQARSQSGMFPTPWALGYAYALFEILDIVGPATDAIAQAFEDRHRQKNLWTFTFKWVREALSSLATQGYRMSVISNSDGRTAQVFRDLRLAHYFEHIFDSKTLGVEKPHPAIFEVALNKLNVSPANALYIGDIFYVDVLGANLVGLGGIHLDPLGLYTGWPGIHLRDMRDLLGWLGNHYVHSWELDLFPLKDLPYPIPTGHETTIPVPKTSLPGEPLWSRDNLLEIGEGWPTLTSGAQRQSQPILAQ